MSSRPKQVTFDERYVESLLLEKSEIQYADYAAGRELLLSYSHIPEDKISSHVVNIVSALFNAVSLTEMSKADDSLTLSFSKDVRTSFVHIHASDCSVS